MADSADVLGTNLDVGISGLAGKSKTLDTAVSGLIGRLTPAPATAIKVRTVDNRNAPTSGWTVVPVGQGIDLQGRYELVGELAEAWGGPIVWRPQSVVDAINAVEHRGRSAGPPPTP